MQGVPIEEWGTSEFMQIRIESCHLYKRGTTTYWIPKNMSGPEKHWTALDSILQHWTLLYETSNFI